MCIVAIALFQNSTFPLVIAHNRDELRTRLFTPLSLNQLNFDDPVYAGIDQKSDGMWFGVTQKGKIGLLTNYRDRSRWNPEAPSRGVILKKFFQSQLSPKEFLEELSQSRVNFNPYNLILGQTETLFYWNSDERKTSKIEPGFHVLSNSRLNTPWPKAERLRASFSETVRSHSKASFDTLEANLIRILKDRSKAEINQLPKTGLALERELAVSSIFVESPEYGTLTSTLYATNTIGISLLTEYQHRRNGSASKRFFEIPLKKP